MYQKNQNQTQVPNLNNASVQHPSTSQPGGMVPEARQALEDMKYEIAGELGINLKQGYNGDLPSRQAGSIGGYMVNPLLPAAQYLTLMTAAPISFTRTRENMRSEHLEICYNINLTVAV